MVDVGAGQAIIVIPGIQGRWEWMRPAVDALARQWRVVTSSLPGEPGSLPFSDEAGFEQLVRHVDDLMDGARLSSAVICGVSFGGLVALRYAARRRERVRALILVSAPGPRWTPQPQQRQYMKRPTLSSPLFAFGAFGRLWLELRVTFPALPGRLRFLRCGAWTWLAAPAIPSRMGRRARLAATEQFDDDCARISVPTLVIAGEQNLDKVVRTDDTMEYVRLIPGAQFQRFRNTGHLGTMSQPDEFAVIVSSFLKGLSC